MESLAAPPGAQACALQIFQCLQECLIVARCREHRRKRECPSLGKLPSFESWCLYQFTRPSLAEQSGPGRGRIIESWLRTYASQLGRTLQHQPCGGAIISTLWSAKCFSKRLALAFDDRLHRARR